MKISAIRRLRRNQLPASTVQLARFLIGKTLVRELPSGRLSGRIVETEAYLPDDAACHAFRGPTPRNRSLFLEHGHAYVYFIYGSSFMMNVSGEKPGIGAGVLLRAIEPIEGIDWMKRHRRTKQLLDLARGPGRLASAMKIDHRLDGVDLCADGPIWLGTAIRRRGAIGASCRIGITRDAHLILRFYERGNAFVSGPARLRA
ncbi:MAG TPA: DNA-3-methyladenine glycosylase [Candidatus Acidoferrales bacterium]|nr:DNA-3-methyladenine glycosylase [Candidatus Acidoferrales bacterium]